MLSASHINTNEPTLMCTTVDAQGALVVSGNL